jgi:hypothetical protein
MAKRSSLRASDSDRERLAERLRHATAEGRLSAKELEERLEVLFAARTYGDLDALLADLSASRWPRWQRVRAAQWAGAVSGTLALALLGRLALMRRHSGAAAVTVAEHRGQPTFRGPLVDPHRGLIVAASIVRLSCDFADMRRSPLGVDALGCHLTVAPGFVEPELVPRPTASRLVSVATSGGACN